MAQEAFGKGHHLHLIDGSTFIFRAYHALPPLTRSDGLPVGALAGFCDMIFKYIEDNRGPDAPTHAAVVFDASGHSFRNDLYPAYKANRPDMPEDLRPQIPLTREATRAFNLASLELEGYEADDIIATLASRARAAGGRVTILSSDKDLMQLVGGGVEMLDPMKSRRIGPEQVAEKFGVGPDRVVDVQALAGDSTDNVPGAPGIGVKTAALLINEFGDLDTLLARADEVPQKKRRETLEGFADQIRLSRSLVRLDTDSPLPWGFDALEVRDAEPETLLRFLQELELRKLAGRVADRLGAALQLRDGIALYAGARYNPTARDAATFDIFVMPNEGVTLAEAEAALDRELAALVEAGPDPARLSRIKARLRADRIYDLDRIQSRARQFGVALSTGLSPADIAAWPAAIDAVTAEDVVDAAQRFLDRDAAVTGYLRAPAPQIAEATQ
jgi:5'-3' exonuclease